jgi:5-formyltetrahydrofolate cyclo-ligase
MNERIREIVSETLLRVAKRELRKRLRNLLSKRLRGMTEAWRANCSAKVRALLARQQVWWETKVVLFYAALPDEIDLGPLLEQALAEGKAVALPRYTAETGIYEACQIENYARDCAPGKFGIIEPAARCPKFALNRLDLALVPGVGFDAAGHRLGRGKGYYDRLLAHVPGNRCGVAFDEQMTSEIPTEAHDITLDYIITPTQWLEIPGRPPICHE